jgi:hypothetical protein
MKNVVGLLCGVIAIIAFTPAPYSETAIKNSVASNLVSNVSFGRAMLKDTDFNQSASDDANDILIASMDKRIAADKNWSTNSVTDMADNKTTAAHKDTVLGSSGNQIKTPAEHVPEPGTMLIFGIGVAGLAVLGVRRRN